MVDFSDRGTGWKADTEQFVGETDILTPTLARQKFGAVSKRRKENKDLGKYCFVRDQFSSSLCVGFALTGAVYARLHALGIPCELLSPFWTYDIAVMFENMYGGPKSPTIDINAGSHPFLAYSGMRKFGMLPERALPFYKSEREVPRDGRVKEPDFINASSASQFRVAHFTRIPTVGRWNAVLNAIDSGHPVPLGMMVGSEFMRYQKGNGPVGVEETNVAGHMTFLWGYEDYGNVLIGCNSWSRDYGDDGHYRITREKLEHESTTDLSEFTITEKT